MQEVTYIVHIEPAQEGGYFAFFPALPGCHTQGESLEEVVAMAQDVLIGYLDSLHEHGQPIPVESPLSRRVGFDLPISAPVR
jgi:predicted RNase H-like HicB family nuclease